MNLRLERFKTFSNAMALRATIHEALACRGGMRRPSLAGTELAKKTNLRARDVRKSGPMSKLPISALA